MPGPRARSCRTDMSCSKIKENHRKTRILDDLIIWCCSKLAFVGSFGPQFRTIEHANMLRGVPPAPAPSPAQGACQNPTLLGDFTDFHLIPWPLSCRCRCRWKAADRCNAQTLRIRFDSMWYSDTQWPNDVCWGLPLYHKFYPVLSEQCIHP